MYKNVLKNTYSWKIVLQFFFQYMTDTSAYILLLYREKIQSLLQSGQRVTLEQLLPRAGHNLHYPLKSLLSVDPLLNGTALIFKF